MSETWTTASVDPTAGGTVVLRPGASPVGLPRGRLAKLWQEAWPRMRRKLPRDMAILLILYAVTRPFSFSFVMTDSVHTSAALILKGTTPAIGDMVVFSYAGGVIPNYYLQTPTTKVLRSLGLKPPLDGPRKGDGFLKYLIGVPGDRIEVVDRRVYLVTAKGRLFMGEAKPVTRTGVPLEPIRPQVIPAGFIYVWAPHIDALDSRYAVMGLVPDSSIVGKAVPLW